MAGYFPGGFIAGTATASSVVLALSNQLHPGMAVGPVGLGLMVHRSARSNIPPPDEILARVATTDSAYAAIFLSAYDAEYRRRKRKAIGAGSLIGLVVLIPLFAFGYSPDT